MHRAARRRDAAWWSALVVVRLCGSASGLVTSVSYLASSSIPRGQEFFDASANRWRTLEDVSGCRFRPDAPNRAPYALVLVGDQGVVYEATIDGRAANPQIQSRVTLQPPAPSMSQLGVVEKWNVVDAESLAFVGGHLFIASEEQELERGQYSPLAVARFDEATGEHKPTPAFEIPPRILNNTGQDEGFESLVATDLFARKPSLVTTTEYAMTPVDRPGNHTFLVWDAVEGGAPYRTLFYNASFDDFDVPYGISDMAAMGDDALLTLERSFKYEDSKVLGDVDKIRIFEVGVDADSDDTTKTQLVEWARTLDIDPSVDMHSYNFEAMCFYPDARTLLLINDEDKEDDIHFVALRLVADGDDPLTFPYSDDNRASGGSSSSKNGSSGPPVWLYVILPVGLAIIVAIACVARRRKHRAKKNWRPRETEMTFGGGGGGGFGSGAAKRPTTVTVADVEDALEGDDFNDKGKGTWT